MKAMDLIAQDFEEINIERPQIVAKLLVNLEQGADSAYAFILLEEQTILQKISLMGEKI